MATEFELTSSGSSSRVFDVLCILAESKINLDTVAAAKIGDRYVVKFLASREDECRKVLVKEGAQFKEREVLVIDIDDKPGGWVTVARDMATAGIDTNTSYMIRTDGKKTRFVLGVSDYERARRLAAEMKYRI